MPRATTCRLNGQLIDVTEALRIRDQAVVQRASYPGFTSIHCGERVRPHKQGATG